MDQFFAVLLADGGQSRTGEGASAMTVGFGGANLTHLK